jgi:hypothetical protein
MNKSFHPARAKLGEKPGRSNKLVTTVLNRLITFCADQVPKALRAAKF